MRFRVNNIASLTILAGMLSGCVDTSFTARDIRKEALGQRAEHSFEYKPDSKIQPNEINLDALKELSAERAGEIALNNNAQFRADLSALGIAEADIKEAGLLRNPRIDLLTGMNEKPFEFLLTYPSEAFWQRPFRVALARDAYEQQAEALVQNGLDVIRDAKLIHADLLLAEEKAILASEAVSILSEIQKATDVRLKAGDITELESLAVHVEVGTAHEQETRLKNDENVSQERLKNVLGLPPLVPSISLVGGEVELTTPSPLPDLLATAAMRRPDLRASELGIKTALSKVDWEHSRILNLFSFLVSMKQVGVHGLLTSPGVAIEIPIFNHNQGQISRADAEVEQAVQRYLNLKQRVGFETAEALALLIQAQDAYKINQEKVTGAARRSKEQALEQYNKGEVSYLFVLQQSRALIDAQMRAADLKATIRKASAQLDRCLGGR